MEENIKKSAIDSETENVKGRFIKWVKAHKKELIFAGVSIALLIGIILGIKNKDSIKKLWDALQKRLAKLPSDKTAMKVTENAITVVQKDVITLPAHREYKAAFDVTGHVRNLYKGRHASPEKIVAAAALGIELLPGQTWVENYTKGAIAA